MNKLIALLLLSSTSCIFRPNFPEELCGDGDVDLNEQCDDANQNNNDGCHNNCTTPGCGDGVIDPDTLCLSQSFALSPGNVELTDIFGFPGTMRFADLNNDGDLDYVISAPGSNKLISGLNNGAGLFQSISTNLPNPEAIALADIDQNGTIDVVVSCTLAPPGGNVTFLLGNGDGTFGEGVTIRNGNLPLALLLDDLDGDELLDLPISLTAAGDLATVFNDSLEVFSIDSSIGSPTIIQQNTLVINQDLNPTDLVVADIDRDGSKELLAAHSNSNTIGVFSQNLGVFSGPIEFEHDIGTFGIAVADFDGDNDLDIVAANTSGSLTIGINDGVAFAPSTTITSGFVGLQRVKAVDINLDGALDLIAAINDPEESSLKDILILLGNGDGTFQTDFELGTTILSAGVGSFDLFVGDLNGDNAADIAVLNVFSNDISIILANP
jgi:large repetitive protein